METQKPLSEFTDEELLQEEKKRKGFAKYNAFAIGMLAGIAFYSVVRNGFNFLLILLIDLFPIRDLRKIYVNS